MYVLKKVSVDTAQLTGSLSSISVTKYWRSYKPSLKYVPLTKWYDITSANFVFKNAVITKSFLCATCSIIRSPLVRGAGATRIGIVPAVTTLKMEFSAISNSTAHIAIGSYSLAALALSFWTKSSMVAFTRLIASFDGAKMVNGPGPLSLSIWSVSTIKLAIPASAWKEHKSFNLK